MLSTYNPGVARRTDGGVPGGSRRSTAQTRRRRAVPAIALGAMCLGIAGLLVMLPAVSDACQPVPATSDFSAEQVADAIAPGSDVLIVGDSYTTGRGSYDDVHGWAQDLVSERQWDATINGYPGTGYVNPGRGRSSRAVYLSRIEQRAALTPDLVIVQGSQNDWLTDSATLEKTVERTLRQAEVQWPDAVVVAIGPSAPQPRAEATTGINDAVAAGASAVGVPYIDAIDGQWFTAMNSGSYAATDQQHLNDAGYLYLAGKIDAELEQLATQPDGEQCL
jgi:lysophospholipase L1-like esterase